MGGTASEPGLRLAPGGTWGGVLLGLLYCWGNNERQMKMALVASADVVILNLEDPVHPVAKSDARALVAKVLTTELAMPIVVRANADDTGWHLPNLAAILPAHADGRMLPKCGGLRAVRRPSDRLDSLGASSTCVAAPDGRMVDKAHLRLARRTLDVAELETRPQ